jgi:hypothetical protein
LRPIAKGEDETREQKADVGILEDRVENVDRLATDDGRVLEGIGQDKERDEEVALDHTQTRQVSMRRRILLTTRGTHQGKPREDEIESLVEKFDVYPEFAPNAV